MSASVSVNSLCSLGFPRLSAPFGSARAARCLVIHAWHGCANTRCESTCIFLRVAVTRRSLPLAAFFGGAMGGNPLSKPYLASSALFKLALSAIHRSKTGRWPSVKAAGALLTARRRRKSRSARGCPLARIRLTESCTCALLILATALTVVLSRLAPRGMRSSSAQTSRNVSKASRTSRLLSTADARTEDTGVISAVLVSSTVALASFEAPLRGAWEEDRPSPGLQEPCLPPACRFRDPARAMTEVLDRGKGGLPLPSVLVVLDVPPATASTALVAASCRLAEESRRRLPSLPPPKASKRYFRDWSISVRHRASSTANTSPR
mmetsp:Transcript_27362/g.63845  ORF Transcript_27362/g.63845 Transcript_27362/m.63845 type:complete len:322 (+) Transcript_27362:775-1740(+)